MDSTWLMFRKAGSGRRPVAGSGALTFRERNRFTPWRPYIRPKGGFAREFALDTNACLVQMRRRESRSRPYRARRWS